MNRPAFRPLEAFENGEQRMTHINTGKGLDELAKHINAQLNPLKEVIHHKFTRGNHSRPYHSLTDIKPFFRDEVLGYALDTEEDYRIIGLTRGGPRAAIIHPYSVAFNTQTLNGTNEQIVASFMHDSMEDYPQTLEEFVEYYTTGSLKGNFTIPAFALGDIKKLTNREGFIAKMLDRELRKEFFHTYNITKTTNKEIQNHQEQFYTRERVNNHLNKMLLRVNKLEPINGDNSETIKIIQTMINQRIDNGYTPHQAITDVNRTSKTYDLYIQRLHRELPQRQRGRKIDDRTDNIGDDKYGKAKHKIRSLYKAYKIIDVMNIDENFMSLPAEDMFRLNTLKERFVHRLFDKNYIDLRKVKRKKLNDYKTLMTEMKGNSWHLIDEVNDYKGHPDTKVFIKNLTPYTQSKTERQYHFIKKRARDDTPCEQKP